MNTFTICNINLIKKYDMGGKSNTHGETRNAHHISWLKNSRGKIHFVHLGKDNIKIARGVKT
jgi:hypothetical protein